MKPLIDGMLTGLLLQLALGPVFFYILGITMDSNYMNSLSAIFAVTLADYIFIVLSLIGIGPFFQSEKVKIWVGMTGAIVLILFGSLIFYKGFMVFSGPKPLMEWTLVNSFTSCFALTISSPLTIVFWGSIFSAKAIEKRYKQKQLVIFGLGTGASTFIFLSLTMMILSFLKSEIPHVAVQILNCSVGLALIFYGTQRMLKQGRPRQKKGI
ncbi:MAG: LysE family transporter [Desulfobacter sp.]|nr:LysE family transporter [Desulfobacter sp.]